MLELGDRVRIKRSGQHGPIVEIKGPPGRRLYSVMYASGGPLPPTGPEGLSLDPMGGWFSEEEIEPIE